MNHSYGYGVPKKNRGGIIGGIVVFLIVLLGICGIFYYKLVFGKNSFELFLDYAFDYLENSFIDDDVDSVTGAFSFDFNLKSGDVSDNQVLELFNKLYFSGNYGIDYDRNILNLDFYSNYGEDDLFDFSIYTEYGKAYVYLDGLYNKYIESSVDNYSELFERASEDSKVMISSVRNALSKSLKKDYFEVEKVMLDSVKVTKTTLDLDEENCREIRNSFVGILLKDEEFLKSFAKVTEREVSEIKSSLEDTLKEEIEVDSEMVIYTKGLQFVRFEEVDDESYFVIDANDGDYNYKYYEDDKLVLDGRITVTEKDDGITVGFSCDDKEEQFGFEIIVYSSMKKNGKVEEKDVTNSISSEKMSEDDMAEIYSKLMKNEGVVKIIDEISKLAINGGDNSSLGIVTG